MSFKQTALALLGVGVWMQGLISGLLLPCSQRPLFTVCSGKRWGGGGCVLGGLAVSTRGRRGLPPAGCRPTAY